MPVQHKSGGRVYHWKHGWIPLDHAAAVSKYGSSQAAKDHGFASVSHDSLPRKAHIVVTHDTKSGNFQVHDTQTGAKASLTTAQADELQAKGDPIAGVTVIGGVRTAPRSAQELYGDALRVTDEQDPRVQAELLALTKIPEHFREVLKVGGSRIRVGKGSVADIGFTAEDTPRGWPPGYGWDQVGGVQSQGDVWVAAGPFSGSVSTALHETGHAIDYQMGYPSLSSEFKAILNSTSPDERMPYFAQPGQAGYSEAFGEMFAAYHASAGFPQQRRVAVGNSILARGASREQAQAVGAAFEQFLNGPLSEKARRWSK